MLAFVDGIIMPDVSGVNRIRQHPVYGCSRPLFCLVKFSRAGGSPCPGSQSEAVDFMNGLLQRFKRQIFFKNDPDRFGFLFIDLQFLCQRIGTISHHGNSTAEFPSFFSAIDCGFHSVDDQIPFECGKCDENVQEHPSGTVGSVDVLCHGNEMNVVLFKELLEFCEIYDGAGKTVNLITDDHIDLSCLDISLQPGHGRPVHIAAGESSVVVTFRKTNPPTAFLTGNVTLACFPLRGQGIEVSVKGGIFHGFSGITCASDDFFHYFTPKNFLPFHCVPVMANAAPERDR